MLICLVTKNKTMKVYKDPCKNCLLSADAIVSPKRRKEIINHCVSEQTHFICHKSSSHDICCKTFYDKMGNVSQLVRIAERLKAVEFIEQPEAEKLPSHREMNAKYD
jgi:hypothetical protein